MYNQNENPSESLNNESVEASARFPMRVVLISGIGEMFTLWLPPYSDGRYRFTDSAGIECFPFFFEQENGVWVAKLERSARFYRTGANGNTESMGKKQALKSMQCLRIMYNGVSFIIYTEEEHPGDHVFLPYYFEERTDYTIGRMPSNHICYPNTAVSREHAALHWDGNSWVIIDKNSTNGTYVNGRRINKAVLNVGDTVFIVGMYIVVGVGFLAINNKNNRVSFSTPKIRHIMDKSDVSFSALPKTKVPYEYFDRAPRKVKKISPGAIEIEPPPISISGNNVPLLLRLGSPMLMGGRALMTGNIFMAMTSMAIPALTQGFTEKERKEYEKKRQEGYTAYLQFITNEIYKEKVSEEKELNFNYPELNASLNLASNKQRLWDRRKSDDDFLEARLGVGNLPLIAELSYQKKRFQIEPDNLEEEMYKVAERPVILNNVPIMHSFVENYITGISGEREKVLSLVNNIIVQLAASHSYDELKIVLIADETEAKRFDFVKYLPHAWNNEKSIRYFVTSQSDALQLTAHLNNIFEETLKSNSKYNIRSGVSYIVFALSKELYDCVEIFNRFLEDVEYKGMSIVTAFDGLPKECAKVIDLQSQNKIIDYFHPEKDEQQFNLDYCDSKVLSEALRGIYQTKLKLDGADYMLPSMVTFLEMFNAGKVEHLNPLKRWGDNNPIKSLAAPVGVGTDGKLFNLDLHEKRQGPHGLVAGMTGSGKSEFLITYILSMAVNYSPDEIAFVLIDYKGGGLADAFVDPKRGIHLPHVVGTITNLDGAAINRSLMSIKSELKRRQAIFKKAKSETNEGTMDIYDYQKLYRSKRVSEPLPHLIIISDEFAEMKAQQPEFMNELISTARIGRSLGVHLILATQKPGGVVNDQIRSNTKFQVCLRVQDRSDSMDMIKRPDAAELKNTGRFYLQVGYNEYFAQGQSAWCGAEYVPQNEVVEVKDNSVRFVDNIGSSIHSVEPLVKKEKTGTKQIVAIVKYLSDLAVRENIEPRQLWIDPIPNSLDYDEISEKHAGETEGYMQTIIGMVDDPEWQKQYPFVLDCMKFNHLFMTGSNGSGKSSFVQTMVMGLAQRYTPEEFNCYIIELGATALNGLKKLPHCGAYLTDSNEADIKRLFDFIDGLVEERRKIFTDNDVTNYDAYLQVGKMPMVFVIMDGYSNIKSLAAGNEYYNTMHERIRAASGTGIKYIFTCNNYNELSVKAKQEIDYKVALNAKDRYAYAEILDTKVRLEPLTTKGRGLCMIDGRPLEYQLALLNPNANEQERALFIKQRVSDIADKNVNAQSARALPVIKDGQTYEEFCAEFEPGCIPLGYLLKDTRKISMPFQQLYELSLYFGNPLGVKPILNNFIEAGRHNGMDLVIVRRQSNTIFDSTFERELKAGYSGKVTVIDSSVDGVTKLDQLLIEEITARNVFRDEYSRLNGIPATEKGRAMKAIRYIRERTKPLMILFECFADFCTLEMSEEMVIEMKTLVSRTRGYNIYFVGCFYPNEDADLMRSPIMQSFNEDEVLMLFGGQYDKANFTNLPFDMKKFDKMSDKYDRYTLKYRSNFNTLLMPCGELINNDGEPDEAPIV